MPEAYIHVKPIARKQHYCHECHGTILKGEKYNKHSGIWDGRPDTFKICGECEYIRFDLCSGTFRDEESQIAFGELSEAVFESDDPKIIGRFIENKEKRGATVQKWMLDLLDDLLNKEDDKHEKY